MCREFNSPKDTLDEVRVTTLLATIKSEDNPPTSNAAWFHLSRSFCQAAKWVHASLSLHSDLPSPVASGGFKEEQGHLVPIMVTLEPICLILYKKWLPATIREIVNKAIIMAASKKN